MSPYDRWPRKRGMVPHEPLLVILIVMILALAMLPLMEPYVVKAQYYKEVIPVAHSLWARTELYSIENERLPGLGVPSEGVLGGTSQLTQGLSRVQTVAGTNAAFAADFSGKVDIAATNHVLAQVGVDYGDLTGKRLRPQHMQYRADVAESNRYCYALGVFGDGKRLRAGTGYAVMEVVNADAKRKCMMAWRRFRSFAEKPKQIVMVNAEEARRHFNCETPEQAAKMNLCWVGDTEALMSGDKARVEAAMEELRKAGWEW